MIKNNIKSFLIHIVISIAALIVYIPFHFSAVKWVSEEAALKHHIYLLIIACASIIGALFVYYCFSRMILINQENIIKNMMSLSLTVLIGIVLWLTAFSIDLTGGTKILLNSGLWQLYSIYYGYCLFLVDEINSSSPYIMLIFCILPVLFMWLGITRSKKLKIMKNT